MAMVKKMTLSEARTALLALCTIAVRVLLEVHYLRML